MAKNPTDRLAVSSLDTLVQAESALDAAEVRISELLIKSLELAPAASPASPDPMQDDEDGPFAAAGGAAKESLSCGRACRALASMTRAAGRLCELTGSDDDRCLSAEARTAASRELIVSACSSCAG